MDSLIRFGLGIVHKLTSIDRAILKIFNAKTIKT